MDRKKLLYIDETELNLLLTKNKEHIGKDKSSDFDRLIAAIAFIISIIFTNFNDIIKTVCIMIGCVYLFYTICLILKNWSKPFSKDILFQQIKELDNMETHSHSIVLLKNTFQDRPNKYLVYYDARWDCRLFLNYKTYNDLERDVDNIINHLQLDLQVDKEYIQGSFSFSKIHEKYSVSAQKNKCYNHSFYEYKISQFPELLKQPDFEIDGKHFYWMSIAEMEADPRIMEVNADIVKMVKNKE